MKLDNLFPEDGAEIRVRGYSTCVQAIYLTATGEVHGCATIMRGTAIAFGSATDGDDIVPRAMAAASTAALDASGEAARRAQRMRDRWDNEAHELASARWNAVRGRY